MAKVALIDIVNLPAFEEAAELFYRATKMTVSFPDREGNIVFYPGKKRCVFCRLIQSTEKGRELCRLSDKHAADAALRQQRPMYYTCHAGLIDVVAPIVVGGEGIGCFYSGQSLLSPPTPEGFEDIKTRVADLDLDPHALWEAYRRVHHVDGYKLEMAVELLSIICSHLVQGRIELTRERRLTRAAVQRAKLERDLREMELRLSQAQLNPHFLFNSLNLILGEAQNENAVHTARLVEDLSMLLSNALTSIGSMVTLDAEIENAQAYVAIFQARFGKKIEMEIDLPRALSGFKVPALILQPIVENALVHAFPKCNQRFVIRISASDSPDRSDKSVEIRASDNGPGMSEKDFASISKALRGHGHHGKMTGLPGLNRRLRYYYSASRLEIQPIPAGTTVVIRLPRGV